MNYLLILRKRGKNTKENVKTNLMARTKTTDAANHIVIWSLIFKKRMAMKKITKLETLVVPIKKQRMTNLPRFCKNKWSK